MADDPRSFYPDPSGNEEAEKAAVGVAWWDNHANLLVLLESLRDSGAAPEELIYAVEKPWKFNDEYLTALEEAEK